MKNTSYDIDLLNAARIVDVFGQSVNDTHYHLFGGTIPPKLSVAHYLNRNFKRIKPEELWRLNYHFLRSGWEHIEDTNAAMTEEGIFEPNGLVDIAVSWDELTLLDFYSDLSAKLKIYKHLSRKQSKENYPRKMASQDKRYKLNKVVIDSYNHHVLNPKKNCIYYGYFEALVDEYSPRYKPTFVFMLRELDPDEVAFRYFNREILDDKNGNECRKREHIGNLYSRADRNDRLMALSKCLRSAGIKYLIIDRSPRFGGELIIDNFSDYQDKLDSIESTAM